MLEQALLLALPILFFLGGAFVEFLFAFGEGEIEFGSAPLPMHVERHQGVAALFSGADEAAELAIVQQQLAGTDRIGLDVSGCRRQRRDIAADQPSLAILDDDVALLQTPPTRPQGFHLPTFQHEASLEGVLDMVVVTGPAIKADSGAAAALGFCVLFAHARYSIRAVVRSAMEA